MVEVDLEVVGVELQLLTRSLWISGWLLGEQGECGASFHCLLVNSDVKILNMIILKRFGRALNRRIKGRVSKLN